MKFLFYIQNIYIHRSDTSYYTHTHIYIYISVLPWASPEDLQSTAPQWPEADDELGAWIKTCGLIWSFFSAQLKMTSEECGRTYIINFVSEIHWMSQACTQSAKAKEKGQGKRSQTSSRLFGIRFLGLRVAVLIMVYGCLWANSQHHNR